MASVKPFILEFECVCILLQWVVVLGYLLNFLAKLILPSSLGKKHRICPTWGRYDTMTYNFALILCSYIAKLVQQSCMLSYGRESKRQHVYIFDKRYNCTVIGAFSIEVTILFGSSLILTRIGGASVGFTHCVDSLIGRKHKSAII